MSIDLIYTGKYGVLNAQKLLNSTSNNINNVNTEGYVRKETLTYTSCVDWGVGATYTRRLYDQFVQKQMYTDQGNKSYYEAYASGMDTADRILSDETMSLANATTKFFDALSTAANSPTSAANRNEAKGQLENLVGRINSANNTLVDSLNEVNGKISDEVADINSYTQAICKINDEIRVLSLSDVATNNEIYMQMLDERDRLIGKLSEHVAINVQIQSDNTYEVYMDSGMLLANGDTYATLVQGQNEFDVTKSEIHLTYNSIAGGRKDNTDVKLTNNSIGGALGGYLNSTTEIRNSMREIGKLTVALADALNVQNKAGFTLEDIAGSNLINVKGVYATSTNDTQGLYCTFNEGQGSNVQGYDFKVSFSDGDLHVYRVEEDERMVEITADIPAADIVTNGNNTTITLNEYGLTFNMNASLNQLKNDKTVFYVQPTLMVGSTVESNVSKPEDFAFASAVRTGTKADNYGNATIVLSSCTNTGADFGVSVDPATKKPVFNTGAPSQIKIDAQGNYLIYDNNNTLLGMAPASTKGTNVFANAVTYDRATNSFTNTPLAGNNGYPGYDVSINGTVKENDEFYVEINSGGQADNSNGNALIGIRSQSIVRSTGSSQVTTFNDGYANLLGELGTSFTTATANKDAAAAKLEQTTKLYQSTAGVNLDEEATNLVMYQQTYQACAKIIEASQTIFNALIGAF